MSRAEVSPTDEYTVRDQQMMGRATKYFAWQARLAKEQLGRRVVEIGSGIGNFTRHLVDREMVIGVDVVDACVEEARARFATFSHVQFRRLDVTDVAFRALKEERPDTVVCLNVLEHVEDDLRALQNVHHVLAPAGRGVFLLPAFEFLYGPIDRNLGHFRRYSKRGWEELAARAGFRVVRARYFNSLGLVAWWANAKILRMQAQSESQIGVFDRALVPLLSRAEDWIEPPFGQSIFAVIEKT